jgi:hypothetical protein
MIIRKLEVKKKKSDKLEIAGTRKKVRSWRGRDKKKD